MTKPPAKNNLQPNYIKSALRLPPELHAEVSAAAEHNGRSLNAEIIARLRDSKTTDVLAELAELKQIIQKLIEQK